MKDHYEKIFMEELEKIKPFYEMVVNRADSTGNLLDRMYRHDAKDVFSKLKTIQGIIQDFGKDGEHIAQEVLKSVLENDIPQLKDLEGLVKMGDLTREEILKGESNFHELMKRQEGIHKEYLDSQNIKYNTFGDSENLTFNSLVASALIGTQYGNAAKWALPNTEINQNIKTKNNKAIIKIENEFGQEPQNYNIGQNLGIGTLFTDTILKSAKGSIAYYNEAKLSDTKNPIYGIKITLPLK